MGYEVIACPYCRTRNMSWREEKPEENRASLGEAVSCSGCSGVFLL